MTGTTSTPRGLPADCYNDLLIRLQAGQKASVKDRHGKDEPVVLRNWEIYEVNSQRKVVNLDEAVAQDKNSKPVSLYGSLFFAGFKLLCQQEHLSVFQRGELTMVYDALTNRVARGSVVQI
jgi:hypothetical protein